MFSWCIHRWLSDFYVSQINIRATYNVICIFKKIKRRLKNDKTEGQFFFKKKTAYPDSERPRVPSFENLFHSAPHFTHKETKGHTIKKISPLQRPICVITRRSACRARSMSRARQSWDGACVRFPQATNL